MPSMLRSLITAIGGTGESLLMDRLHLSEPPAPAEDDDAADDDDDEDDGPPLSAAPLFMSLLTSLSSAPSDMDMDNEM